MVLGTFPCSVEELSVEWLSEALGLVVDSITVERIGEETGFLSEVYRVKLEVGENVEETLSSVVIKFPNSTGMGSTENLYKNEIEFYRYMKENGTDGGINSPCCYYIDSDSDLKRFILIIEDCKEPYSVGNLTAGLSTGEMKESLKQLARFHASWWGCADDVEFKHGKSAICMWSPLLEAFWNRAGKKCLAQENLLNERVERCVDFIIRYSKSIQPESRTLVHGDYRPDNMMVFRGEHLNSERRIIVVDYQGLHIGNPGEDLAYHLSCGVSEENRRKNEEEYLNFYHRNLMHFGVSDYTFDECKKDYRENLIYSLLVPVMSAGHVVDGEHTKTQLHTLQMMKLWRSRCVTAVCDNRCDDLIDELSARFHANLIESEYPELDSELASYVEYYQKEPIDWKEVTLEERRDSLSVIGQASKDSLRQSKETAIASIQLYERTDTCPELKVLSPAASDSTGNIVLYIPDIWIGGFGLDESTWRQICMESKSHVVAVNHCTAPENSAFDIIDDCLNALWHVIRSPETLNLPKVSDVILLGEKQGAHPAVCLIRKLIETNHVSLIQQVILVCPWLDPQCNGKSYSLGNRYGNLIGVDYCTWSWKHYMIYPVPDQLDPLDYEDSILSQFPATTIIAAEYDTNRSDADVFGAKLKENNVQVDMEVVRGVIGLFFNKLFSKGNLAFSFIASKIK